jgi:hypothetical protein
MNKLVRFTIDPISATTPSTPSAPPPSPVGSHSTGMGIFSSAKRASLFRLKVLTLASVYLCQRVFVVSNVLIFQNVPLL